MVDLDTNINITHNYGGGMYCALSNQKGGFTFCKSYEGDWICTKTSMWHSEGAEHFFQKTVTFTE